MKSNLAVAFQLQMKYIKIKIMTLNTVCFAFHETSMYVDVARPGNVRRLIKWGFSYVNYSNIESNPRLRTKPEIFSP